MLDGLLEGVLDGLGLADTLDDGDALGVPLGLADGLALGVLDGLLEGVLDGDTLGVPLGLAEGLALGVLDGLLDTLLDGLLDTLDELAAGACVMMTASIVSPSAVAAVTAVPIEEPKTLADTLPSSAE